MKLDEKSTMTRFFIFSEFFYNIDFLFDFKKNLTNIEKNKETKKENDILRNINDSKIKKKSKIKRSQKQKKKNSSKIKLSLIIVYFRKRKLFSFFLL